MRRIYTLHPWDLEHYREDELALLFGDMSRLSNATTRTRG